MDGFCGFNFGITCDFGSASKTRTGWTIGGGVEWRFAPQWSAFLEGNYYDFGNNDRNISTNHFFATHLSVLLAVTSAAASTPNRPRPLSWSA